MKKLNPLVTKIEVYVLSSCIMGLLNLTKKAVSILVPRAFRPLSEKSPGNEVGIIAVQYLAD